MSYQSMSLTTVPEPLSAGLMMMSCRRIRRFRARLARLTKLSRSLVGFACVTYWSGPNIAGKPPPPPPHHSASRAFRCHRNRCKTCPFLVVIVQNLDTKNSPCRL